MKVLITGAGGQLAWELARSAPNSIDLIYATSTELNICDEVAVNNYLKQHKPNAIINTAAYTAVDKAEEERDKAYAVNRDGVANLAKACGTDIYLLHISTDFVFDGLSTKPLTSKDIAKPLSVYGASKYAGEQALEQYCKAPWAIIRTAWLYSSYGNNFVKSMLRFMNEREQLNIVADQIGTPTWAHGLAQSCWACIADKTEGLYHWSDAGVASWYDFAEMIQSKALELKLLDKKCKIKAITTKDYPVPAKRPAFSVLDKSEILAKHPQLENQHWQSQLNAMLTELSKQQHKES
ncbi:dTDP-4-dehydrorhamnose reductase [Agaribacterium sp. ZY112]|uniref:dTDP-4-dehydrorhamnose reductase n=1 Tax=Agaribacterium sp. ZY112 TaxID=3233574 RepID=UPI0035236A0E